MNIGCQQALAVMEAALAHTAAAQQAARPLSPTQSSGEKEKGPGALLQDWPTAINPDAHAASKVRTCVFVGTPCQHTALRTCVEGLGLCVFCEKMHACTRTQAAIGVLWRLLRVGSHGVRPRRDESRAQFMPFVR